LQPRFGTGDGGEAFEAPRDLGRIDQQMDALRGDREADPVAVAHSGQRPADGRLRRGS